MALCSRRDNATVDEAGWLLCMNAWMFMFNVFVHCEVLGNYNCTVFSTKLPITAFLFPLCTSNTQTREGKTGVCGSGSSALLPVTNLPLLHSFFYCRRFPWNVLMTAFVYTSSSRNCMDAYPTFLAVMWCAGLCLSQGNHSWMQKEAVKQYTPPQSKLNRASKGNHSFFLTEYNMLEIDIFQIWPKGWGFSNVAFVCHDVAVIKWQPAGLKIRWRKHCSTSSGHLRLTLCLICSSKVQQQFLASFLGRHPLSLWWHDINACI